MRKSLTHIDEVNDQQIAFGKKIGLDLRGCSVTVAIARIEDAIDLGFRGITELGNPTPKQIDFAAKFKCEIAGLSRREGSAIVDDLMTQLNRETINAEGLARGVVVTNINDALNRRYVISSIDPEGTVYFRGGNRKKAWARSLRRGTDA